MGNQKRYVAQADWLEHLVDGLVKAGKKVIAPCQQENKIALQEITRAEQMAVDYLSPVIPLKEIFFPRTEKMLEYQSVGAGNLGQGGDVAFKALEPEIAPSVVIGTRPCDAAALEVTDALFNWDYKDKYYNARRAAVTIVTFGCYAPDQQCFCTTVGGNPHNPSGSDILVLKAADNQYLLEVLSDKGAELITLLGEKVKPADGTAPLPAPAMEKRLDLDKVKPWLDQNFDSPLWDEIAVKCINCGSCTFVCPTCHCFDIIDEATPTLGERRRNWDYCPAALFTLHGSGHNPRPTHESRYRQRIMHKFKYFVDRFNQTACVGCGRCLRYCGMGVNLINILTRISQED